jgi:plasmid replication initiation protein
MTAEALLIELRTSRTDLARLVEAATRDRLTRIVVPQRSVEAWERREPETWTKVSGWLAARGVAIVRV